MHHMLVSDLWFVAGHCHFQSYRCRSVVICLFCKRGNIVFYEHMAMCLLTFQRLRSESIPFAAMPGFHVTIYVMPHSMNGYDGTAFWSSTPTQNLADYEGYFTPAAYAPVYRMLPVLQAWRIPTPLGQQPAYMQAVAEMGTMPTDEAGVRRLLLRIGHYQRLYCFANFGGGLDLYIQGPAATPMYIKYSSATSWDPTYWWAASDWRFVGLVPMAEWAEIARSRL